MNGDKKKTIPCIRSARGYRLYGQDGQRYIDFYQNDGYAMNGHRPAEVLQALKSSAARGVWAEYPSRWQGKIESLLTRLLPFVGKVYLYPNMEMALSDVADFFHARVDVEDTPLGFYDQEEGRTETADEAGNKKVRVLRWRPFSLDEKQEKEVLAGKRGQLCIPLIPFPGKFLPVPVCSLPGGAFSPRELPEISPVLGRLMIKSILQTMKRIEGCASENWDDFDLPGVERVGPYIRIRTDQKGYNELFSHMLGEGVLLPPSRHIPAIIPGEYNEGDVLPLKRALRRLYGNS